MYEELVKRLREIVPWECFLTCKNTMHEAADAIEDLQEKLDDARMDASEWSESLEYMSAAKVALEEQTRWISVTERLPEKFQSIFAACKSEGRENWTIDTVYDPFLKCPWGRIPILESGKAVVYAWMDNSAPEPPKEELE